MLCILFRASSLRPHMHLRSAHDLSVLFYSVFYAVLCFSLSVFCPVFTNLFCSMRFRCCLWSIRFSLLHMAREHSPSLTAHHCSAACLLVSTHIFTATNIIKIPAVKCAHHIRTHRSNREHTARLVERGWVSSLICFCAAQEWKIIMDNSSCMDCAKTIIIYFFLLCLFVNSIGRTVATHKNTAPAFRFEIQKCQIWILRILFAVRWENGIAIYMYLFYCGCGGNSNRGIQIILHWRKAEGEMLRPCPSQYTLTQNRPDALPQPMQTNANMYRFNPRPRHTKNCIEFHRQQSSGGDGGVSCIKCTRWRGEFNLFLVILFFRFSPPRGKVNWFPISLSACRV